MLFLHLALYIFSPKYWRKCSIRYGISSPFPQGRDHNGHHIYSIKEVFSEGCCLYDFLQILLVAYIPLTSTFMASLPPRRVIGWSSRTLRSFCPKPPRHISYFVEKYASPIGYLKLPFPCIGCACKGALS